MPPEWAFGFSQCRGAYTQQDQAMEVADEFRARGIPCDVIYQDIGWTQYLQDFEWRKENYHSPEKMTQYLKQNGFKMIVSQDPVVSQRNKAQWTEADSLGYFVKDVRTGTSYDMPWPWGGNCGVVDFTIPEVADWWGKYQQKPLDDGVAGFWTDMGEPAWSNEEDTDRLNMVHNIGMHDEIHNVYGLTWDKVVTEQFYKRNPGKRVFQMTRSAYAGLQRYTFGWTADSGNGADVLDGWGQFANQVQVGISAGLGGIPFWTTDISGYCGDIKDYPAMAELYTRWMQFGVFCPLSRAHHEGNNAVEPWMFGDEAEKNAKAAIELKYTLFPYIYTYARKSHDTGLPITRGLFMEFPGDPTAVATEDQFMFGEEILVAPVLRKGERTRTLYLPEGDWIDFGDKTTVYAGGKTISYDAPLDVIPIFVKRGSIVPQMPVMQYMHENPDYPVTVDIFPAAKGGKASFQLYEDEGENLDYLNGVYCLTDFVCTTTDSGYDITIEGDSHGFRQSEKRNFELALHITSKPDRVTVGGERIKASSQKVYDALREPVQWMWDEKSLTCRIRIPDNCNKTGITVTGK
jgi:alpha-glucosidase